MEAECPRRMVTCQYCGFDGEYQLIEGEHKELCPKFPLPCPNKCDVGSVPRQDITEHRKMCPLEEVECSNDQLPASIVNLQENTSLLKANIRNNVPSFPCLVPTICDNDLKVSRKDMDTHRKECLLETVQCQYQCVGCDDVMVCKHQREHNKENMEEHLALAVSELINSRQHLVAVEERLQHDVTSMKAELIQKI
ncbi:TNF receptor-associated factor 2-like [Dysidea avara]|uniref:TNF receptor-associated factor 2-like n=1 Tax=Dysidea avara TaxID=196820 RepID=UPI0033327978